MPMSTNAAMLNPMLMAQLMQQATGQPAVMPAVSAASQQYSMQMDAYQQVLLAQQQVSVEKYSMKD